MLEQLMKLDFETMRGWGWAEIEPYVSALEAAPITADTVIEWLGAWAHLGNLVGEVYTRLYVGTTLDTTDKETETRFFAYITQVMEPFQVSEQRLKQKFLATGLHPEGFANNRRAMQTEADLFREANVPLFTEVQAIVTEYDQVSGAQTVQWEGQELTLPQMLPMLQDGDREVREEAWRLSRDRQLADRPKLNEMWGRFLERRFKIAANADQPDFRAYQWLSMQRFDYTPDDCERFRDAIEQVVVPAAAIIYEKRRQQLQVPTLRPWDLDNDPLGRAPLRPFSDTKLLIDRAEAIFNQVDPELGAYFSIMKNEDLLDLANRKNKAPGGYQTTFNASRRPFIFMNAVGLHDDVQTLLHEGGHAFHSFEYLKTPNWRLIDPPTEFAEVGSMGMEMLAGPYLRADNGGYYTPVEAARARIEYLEGVLLFWPYMALVDGFQNWAYTHPTEAVDTAACDAHWGQLWDRFMKGIDYSGLEDIKVTGWHRKLHIFEIPFYYVEYGIAQLGAVQIWRNSWTDAAKAVADYRQALSLGGSVSLPELFRAANARFAMDAPVLTEAVDAIMTTIAQLETVS